LTGSVRYSCNRFAAIAVQVLLGVAALLMLVLGPFVVQCRAPNGVVAAKLLFSECAPEAGCCDLGDDVSVPFTETAETGSGMMDSSGNPCGSCAENVLFLFVNNRGSRDESHYAGSIPDVMVEVHPASQLTAKIAMESLAPAATVDPPSSQDGIHRVLRI
jgi:hypothetical protein